MPLSEDDQRKLDQIEQALAKDDLRFAEAVKHRSVVAAPPDRGGRRRVHHRGGADDDRRSSTAPPGKTVALTRTPPAALAQPSRDDRPRADEDPRPVAAQLLDRAITQLPPGGAKIRCRWDAGYFAADLAGHCITGGIEFAIGVKRNTAVVRALPERADRRMAPGEGHGAHQGRRHRLPARDVAGRAGAVCLARRTRIPVELIPTDARARKLRTIAGQGFAKRKP